MKNNDIIIIPDRLAHYRLPVFNNLAHIAEKLGYNLVIMADLRPDKTGIKKPSYISINNNNFKFVKSLDYRVLNRLILSTGSFKAIYSNARIIIIWGDVSAIGNWIASIIIRLFTNKKLVFWSHGLYGNENRLVKTLRLRFYNMAHQILLYGNYSKSLLLSNGFDPNKLLVINNALDTTIQDELFNNNKLDFVSDVNKIRLLFVGRLTASKKIELLLSAVATLSKTHDVELNIIGDGSEMSNLRNLAND